MNETLVQCWANVAGAVPELNQCCSFIFPDLARPLFLAGFRHSCHPHFSIQTINRVVIFTGIISLKKSDVRSNGICQLSKAIYMSPNNTW